MGFFDAYRLRRAELMTSPDEIKRFAERLAPTNIERLQDAVKARKVLPVDAEEVIAALKDKTKVQEATEAANWLLNPKREELTEAESARAKRGLPRHLTPLENLSRS